MKKACCCLSLSKGCLLLGLFDLAIDIFIIVGRSRAVYETHDAIDIFILTAVVIGVCTCLFMMSGSILENHWLMLPHLAWEILLIIVYVGIGLKLFDQRLQGDDTIDIVMIVVFLGCIPIASLYYWYIMCNRYLQIKNKQPALPDLVAMTRES